MHEHLDTHTHTQRRRRKKRRRKEEGRREEWKEGGKKWGTTFRLPKILQIGKKAKSP